MRILVEVAELGPETRHLIERYGAIIGERREDRLYVLEIREPEAYRRRVVVEEISWTLGRLRGVRDIFISGYRTLWPERWDRWDQGSC